MVASSLQLTSPTARITKGSPAFVSARITNYFSPSPDKAKRHIEDVTADENHGNGAVKKPKCLTQRAHFQTHVIPETDVLHNPTGTSVLGLLKIDDAKQTPKTVAALAGDAKPLFLGSILGRNMSVASIIPSSTRNDKIDLQITSENGGSGVSRKQLLVKKLSTSSVVIQQFEQAVNAVHIFKFDARNKRMSRSSIRLKGGQSIELVPGDVLEFDSFSVKPVHTFRVVRLPPFSSKKRTAATSLTISKVSDVIDLFTSSDSQHGLSAIASMHFQSLPNRKTRTAKSSSKCLHVVDLSASSDSQEENPMDVASVKLSTINIPTLPSPHSAQNQVTEKADNFSITENDKPFRVECEVIVTNEVVIPSHSKKKNTMDDDLGNHPKLSLSTKSDNQAAVESQRAETAGLAEPMINKVGAENTSKEFTVPEPKAGDLFRVAMKTKDIFGRKIMQWYFTEAIGIIPRKGRGNTAISFYQVKVRFQDNKIQQYDYPACDKSIQRIELDQHGSCARCLAFDSSTGEKLLDEVAFDSDPTYLSVGDLVDALYQDGLGSPNDGKWFRARIAEVTASTNTVTVAYYDGDVEYNVPIGKGKIRLVDRGYDKTDWFEMLKVYTTSGMGDEKVSKGTITKLESRTGAVNTSELELKVVHRSGSYKLFSYAQIAKFLFADYIYSVRAENKIMWPNEEQLETMPTKKSKSKGVTSITKRKSKIVVTDDNANNFFEPETVVHHVLKVVDSTTILTMRPSVSNAFFRALDSSEPHMGELFLGHMATTHRRGPTAKTGQNLLRLIMNGPICEGTLFPDPNRLDHAKNYVDLMLAKPGRAKALVESFQISSWADLSGYLLRLLDRVYQVEGDEKSTNKSALVRVQNSLRVAAVLAELIANLFDLELEDNVSAVKKVHYASFRHGKVVKALLENPDGIRDSLKTITKIYTTALIECSHFILSDPVIVMTTRISKNMCDYEAIPSYIKDICFNNATILIGALGKILSYVAWIYCNEQRIGMNNVNLAIDMKNILTSEVDNTKFDPSPFLETKGSGIKNRANFYKEVKMEFVFGFDDSFAAKLQANLAKQLNISKEYTLITEC